MRSAWCARLVRSIGFGAGGAERRVAPRRAVDLPAWVTLDDGRAAGGRAEDISAGGARLRCPLAAAAGQGGVLLLAGLDMKLPFEVRRVGEGALHLAFLLDMRAAAALGAALPRLAG